MAAQAESKLARWLFQGVMVFIGGVFGYLMIRLVTPDNPSLFLLQMFSALLVYVALHETGHAIAAVQQGFKILTFSVWPFAWQRRADSWRLEWVGRLRALGFVAADPISVVDLRRRMIVLVAGGPVATAITAAATGICIFLFRDRWPHWIVDELTLIALWSCCSVVAGLVPYSGKFCVNDAARLRMLRKANAASDRFCCLMLLGAASRAGMRPRDMNRELIDRLPGPDDGSIDWVVACVLRYNALIDSGQKQAAREQLMRLVEHDLPVGIREILQLQAAILEARFGDGPGTARKWFDVATVSKRRDDVYQNALLRAQAAIAFAESRWDDAESAARKSLEKCGRIPDPGAVITIREHTEELLAEIAEARADGSAAPVKHHP